MKTRLSPWLLFAFSLSSSDGFAQGSQPLHFQLPTLYQGSANTTGCDGTGSATLNLPSDTVLSVILRPFTVVAPALGPDAPLSPEGDYVVGTCEALIPVILPPAGVDNFTSVVSYRGSNIIQNADSHGYFRIYQGFENNLGEGVYVRRPTQFRPAHQFLGPVLGDDFLVDNVVTQEIRHNQSADGSLIYLHVVVEVHVPQAIGLENSFYWDSGEFSGSYYRNAWAKVVPVMNFGRGSLNPNSQVPLWVQQYWIDNRAPAGVYILRLAVPNIGVHDELLLNGRRVATEPDYLSDLRSPELPPAPAPRAPTPSPRVRNPAPVTTIYRPIPGTRPRGRTPNRPLIQAQPRSLPKSKISPFAKPKATTPITRTPVSTRTKKLPVSHTR